MIFKNFFLNKFSRIIEIVYIINFLLAMSLMINITMADDSRKLLITILLFFSSILFIDLLSNFFNKENKEISVIFLITKLFFCLMTVIITLFYPYYLPSDTSTQFFQKNIIYLVICYAFYGFLLFYHGKLSGFWKTNWIAFVFCLYIIIWFTFGLGYYAFDKDVERSFTYTDKLEKEIQINRIFKNYIFNSYQVSAIESIIKSDENDINYYFTKINDKDLILTENNIGENWAGFYYEEYLNRYNSFIIRSIEEFNLTRNDFKYIDNYLNWDTLLNKDYFLVKVILYDDNTVESKKDNNTISLKEYDEENLKKIKSQEIQLILEPSKFFNYLEIESNHGANIFLYLLASSNTLLDNTIFDLNSYYTDSANFEDCLYYSAIVITTLGFGDMSPVETIIRFATIVEALLGLIVMGYFLAKAFETRNQKKPTIQCIRPVRRYSKSRGNLEINIDQHHLPQISETSDATEVENNIK